MMRNFINITKPGIIFGNLIAVIGGYCLANVTMNYEYFIFMLIGTTLIIASGCTFNNLIDKDIDAIMERTKHRALVLGLITNQAAIIYAATLAMLGIMILLYYVNQLAATAAMLGLFVYVVLYSIWLKRTSYYSTIIGSIAGAMPPVIGYVAAFNKINSGAILLFMFLAIWQIPHFFAIAIYRLKDYAQAKIPVLPLTLGIFVTKLSIILYLLVFNMIITIFYLTQYVNVSTFIIMEIINVIWFGYAIYGLLPHINQKIWSRVMFIISIITLIVFFFSVTVSKFL